MQQAGLWRVDAALHWTAAQAIVLCKVLPAFLPTDKMAPLITAFALSTYISRTGKQPVFQLQPVL